MSPPKPSQRRMTVMMERVPKRLMVRVKMRRKKRKKRIKRPRISKKLRARANWNCLADTSSNLHVSLAILVSPTQVSQKNPKPHPPGSPSSSYDGALMCLIYLQPDVEEKMHHFGPS